MLRVVAGMMALCAAAAVAQTAAPLAFEEAEVKVNRSGDREVAFEFQPGRLTLRNVTLKDMVAGAYHVADYAVTGPVWIDTGRYDLTARAASGTSESDVRRMLQKFLADRFQLALHHDQKTMSLYALVRGTEKPKMEKSPAASTENTGCSGRSAHLTCKGLSMDDLAETLPRMSPRSIDLPVVNLTALEGAFDFQLDWTPATPQSGNTPPAITIFDAIQNQLGLKLEARKLPVDIIVIDHVEKLPMEN